MSPEGGLPRIERGGFTWVLVDGFRDEVNACEVRDRGIRADLMTFMRDAERGSVRGPEVVTYPVESQHHIGEARLNRRGNRYRLYFAEPDLPTRVVVAVSFCLKLPHGDPAARRMQNADMGVAATRYFNWCRTERNDRI